jgi:DNA-binding LacI/PurR family transcriptional regulator
MGVTPGTVSNVLNGRYKGNYPKTAARAEKIKAYALSRGYRPNAAARAMARQSTRNIGVLVAAHHNDPFTAPEVYFNILGVNDKLETSGYITSIVRIDKMQHQLMIHSRAADELVLDGLIALGAIPERLEHDIENLFGRVIWLDTDVHRPQRCIYRDETGVGQAIGQQIAAAGYRRVLWVSLEETKNSSHYSHLARRRALEQTIAPHGIAFDAVNVFWEWSDDFQAMIQPHLQPDTAVVANNIQRLRIVMRVGMQCGLCPGKDYGLACCDSTQEMLLTWPDLAHAHYDRYCAGQMAATMLLQLLDDADASCPSILLPPDWRQGITLRRCS